MNKINVFTAIVLFLLIGCNTTVQDENVHLLEPAKIDVGQPDLIAFQSIFPSGNPDAVLISSIKEEKDSFFARPADLNSLFDEGLPNMFGFVDIDIDEIGPGIETYKDLAENILYASSCIGLSRARVLLGEKNELAIIGGAHRIRSDDTNYTEDHEPNLEFKGDKKFEERHLGFFSDVFGPDKVRWYRTFIFLYPTTVDFEEKHVQNYQVNAAPYRNEFYDVVTKIDIDQLSELSGQKLDHSIKKIRILTYKWQRPKYGKTVFVRVRDDRHHLEKSGLAKEFAYRHPNDDRDFTCSRN